MLLAAANASNILELRRGDRSADLELDQLGVAVDRVERRAELVTHHGEELRLGATRLLRLGTRRLGLEAGDLGLLPRTLRVRQQLRALLIGDAAFGVVRDDRDHRRRDLIARVHGVDANREPAIVDTRVVEQRLSRGDDVGDAAHRGVAGWREQVVKPAMRMPSAQLAEQHVRCIVAPLQLTALVDDADGIGDRIERRLPLLRRIPHLLLGLADAQQRANGRDELLRLHRVREKRVGAGLEALRTPFAGREARREVNDRNGCGRGVGLQPIRELERRRAG